MGVFQIIGIIVVLIGAVTVYFSAMVKNLLFKNVACNVFHSQKHF